MFKDMIKRLYSEEEGMEMVEWAIVAVFFAVAGSFIWGDVATALEESLEGVISRLEEAP